MTFQCGQLYQIHQKCFYAVGGGGTTITTAAIVPFAIPKEARFVSIMLIGAGGGGAGGATGATGSSRSGGGGGGPGAMANAIFSARTLPSTIFLILPNGGLGGTANNNATATAIALITANPSSITTVVSNQILHTNFGVAGQVAGTGGAAGAASTTANCLLGARALSINFNANTGTGGAAGSPGASTSVQSLCSAGAAGGSTSSATPSAGGSVTTTNAVNIFYSGSASTILVQGGVTATPLAGAQGIDNILSSVPFGASMNSWYSLGGAGGASIDSGTGGNGGNGAIGSGGGGGGAGSTGGNGGDGGPSFCLIEWW